MSTKDRGAQESIGLMDTLDALLLEAVETAGMQDYDHEDVAQRHRAHSETLDKHAYTPYTPPVVSYPTEE